ncbi:MAG: hypothetical protein WCF67_24075 [Chitinophagaceae bacterium]
MRRIVLCLAGIIVFFSFACNKKRIDNCFGNLPVTAIPLIGELIGDSAIATDTAFIGTIFFESKHAYDFIDWKVGSDTRSFNAKKFPLRFPTPEPTFSVTLSVNGSSDPACFPGDDGKDSKTVNLTILPRDSTAKTPLIGKYSGYVEGRSSDTFTVSVEFRNDKRYWPAFGQTPFYTLTNFPKGFRDTTSSIGTIYKELSYGFAVDWGYRALYFNEDYKTAQHVKGYAMLQSRDTLIISYTRADPAVPYNPQTGFPIKQERFVGRRVK